jgi:hypothetical protein
MCRCVFHQSAVIILVLLMGIALGTATAFWRFFAGCSYSFAFTDHFFGNFAFSGRFGFCFCSFG